MLTGKDYRQLAERCALLAGECGAPGVAEPLRALALITWRGLQARSNDRRSGFPDNFVRNRRPARIKESIDRAAPVLNSRQRLQTSAWRRDSAISVADQLRLPYRALRSAPAPCAEIQLRSVQSSHPYGG
jgi:hypothetical protein